MGAGLNPAQSLPPRRAPRRASVSSVFSSHIMAFATKKDEENGLSTYYNNKTTVIQEARVFNDSPISPRKCRALLTRIVYILYVGETFTTQEATTLFFGTTKLFQHKDVSPMFPRDRFTLRRTRLAECAPPDGIPCYQGARHNRGGRDHGHQQHHEGHAGQ